VVGTLAQLAQLPAVDLSDFTPQPDATAAMPVEVAAEFGAMALQIDGHALVVAFAEPPEPSEIDELAGRVGHRIHPVLADPVVIAAHVGSDASVVAQAESAEPSDRTEVVDELLNKGIVVGRKDDVVPLHIDDLLRYAVSVGASDLHLTAAMPGTIRLHGALRPIEGCPPLDNETIRDMVFGILPGSQRERFEEEKELDTSHTIPGVGRFRVNVALQRGTITAALRPIPHEMPVFSSLGLPDSIRSFTDLRRGLVLVTGPTGSGKSTTLASLIDIINRTKPLHIVTVEDPIEFLHDHKRSIITQREIGEDTDSFAEALRRVLRQDPDVILVGELRDLETISMALTAAETGHLVFGTLHTQDAPQTIDRIIDVFPTQQQEQIRVMLASTLEGVVTQQLVPTADGSGRAPCAEVLVCTSAVRNLIRQAKTHQVYSLMQVGGSFGMQTMDQGLAGMVRAGIISESIAYDRSSNEEDLRNHLHH
jgi:twitching motility protein PilT